MHNTYVSMAVRLLRFMYLTSEADDIGKEISDILMLIKRANGVFGWPKWSLISSLYHKPSNFNITLGHHCYLLRK